MSVRLLLCTLALGLSATAHAETLKERVDRLCAETLGDGYEWNGNGNGTQSDPYECTKDGVTQVLSGAGLVSARFASGRTGEVLTPGATLYADERGEDAGEEVLGVAPSDGGNIVVIWPAAPEEADGGNIVVIWPEAPEGIDGGNIVVIWPAADVPTTGYGVGDGEVCGLDSKDGEQWCIDAATGKYTPGKYAGEVSWTCEGGAADREGTVEVRCVPD